MSLFTTRHATLSLKAFKNISKCCYTSESKPGIISDLDVEETPTFEIEARDEEHILQSRDKSRLNHGHRKELNNQPPYDQSYEWYHDTVWYRKRLFGKYGIEAAGINPAVAWPTKEEIEDAKEYEKVAYPLTIQEVWKEIEDKKIQNALEITKR